MHFLSKRNANKNKNLLNQIAFSGHTRFCICERSVDNKLGFTSIQNCHFLFADQLLLQLPMTGVSKIFPRRVTLQNFQSFEGQDLVSIEKRLVMLELVLCYQKKW